MAANKESMVIILDVGIGAEKLTKDAAECSMKVIKNKIFNQGKDMLSFLLFRTETTDNSANTEQLDQYLNICQVLPGSQIPTWHMAKELKGSLNCEKTKSGDWVDALIVAIGIITEDATLHKTRLSKIVLFHNFDSPLTSLDEAIVEKLNELACELIIVSHNIHYIPDSEGNLEAQFKSTPNKSSTQTKNEELAMEFKKLYPLTTFCNFNDALQIISCKKLQRPWSWNCTLAIGSRINIHVSGVIAIKEDSAVPKFQKKPKGLGENIVRQKTYYSGVNEVSDDVKEQQIAGYMLGNTPMPYDPSLGQAPHIDTKKGIYFIGFVALENIPQEHFSGSSTYVLFPQKGKVKSAKVLDSLVRVMMASGASILAWKVYNNSNKPKLVVLIPNMEYDLAGLSMIELSYHSQHRFWDFPKLCTKKNQPTPEQLAAVDQLMGAMDLSGKPTTIEESVDSLNKDRLPLEFLPNIRQHYLIDYLSQTVLKQPSDNSSLEFFKVPDFFQPEATEAVENMKRLFDLKKSESITKDKLKKLFFNGNTVQNEDGGEGISNNGTSTLPVVDDDENKCTHVSTVTPAEDFKYLATHAINKIPNGAERAAKFHQYSIQMCSVISDLLFKSMTKQYEKIRKALMVYREISITANSSYDYNDWMRDVRAKVIERKMFDFWEDVIVKEKLGLCSEEDPQVENDFYDISKEIAASSNVDTLMEDDEDVEDLFGNM
ncbi:uncharacterized protein LOC129919122 [Episyrphus balteatus]|uniref:uncharacterized protein LOC129919122 n=1 Tax=Episyrphus balteatus TaxID=286459 RepID=UPI0024853E6B|nr:uncharacterized protein LOC129919122 [Episyrphus balteatus]